MAHRLAGDGGGGRRAHARQRDALFVQYHNHVPLARRLAADADVAWGGQSSIARGDRRAEEARRAGGQGRDDRTR